MAKKIEKIQHGCQMVAFHKMAAKLRHFALFLTKTVHYYLNFFYISRSLLHSHKLYNIGSLDHADQCLWEYGDLQKWCCHGNSVRKYIYACLQNSLIAPLNINI